MNTPICRAICIGEFSPWARQYLSALSSEKIVEVVFELHASRFAQALSAGNKLDCPLVILENHGDSKAAIEALRKVQLGVYILWIGRTFTKEDLAFAIQHRLYAVLENPRADSKQVVDILKRAEHHRQGHQQFTAIARSAKTILLQAESEISNKPLLNEIKTAMIKMERLGIQDELAQPLGREPQQQTSQLLFHQSQDLSDVLEMIHELERTGVLTISGAQPDQKGKIEVLQGKIMGAHTGLIFGVKAIYRMFLWNSPKFHFERTNADQTHSEDMISTDIRAVVEQGLLLRRRFDVLRSELPPQNIKLTLEPQNLKPGLSLPRHDFVTLAAVVDYQRVADIMDYIPLPDVDIYECLIRLRKSKLLKIAA